MLINNSDYSIFLRDLHESLRDLNSYKPPYVKVPYVSINDKYLCTHRRSVCSHKRRDLYGLRGIYVILSRDYELLYIGKGNCAYRALYRHFAPWCSKPRKDGNGNIFRDTYYDRDLALTKIITIPNSVIQFYGESVIYRIEKDLIETFKPRDNIYHNPHADTSQRNAPTKIVPCNYDADTKTKLTNPPLYNQPDFQILVERGNALFEKYRNENGHYPF